MSISQYLSRYAEEDSKIAQDISNAFEKLVFENLISIACKDEPLIFFDRLCDFLDKQTKALAIVVINQACNTKPTVSNKHLHQAFLNLPHSKLGLHALCCVNSSHILVIDKYSQQQIPAKQGVGLARKIAADIACALYQQQQLLSPWLHCTDADVTLPKNYFKHGHSDTKTAALLYPFKHQCRAGHAGLAMALYEQRLHYYVQALRWAGSPYAYHTIGSLLVINIEHYAKVRGFPKRSAGEDFHLLNKLAKTGNIHALKQPVLSITDRDSDRVPFGTGPAVIKLQQSPQIEQQPLFESPKAIAQLKHVLYLFNDLWHCQNSDKAWQHLQAQCQTPTVKALTALSMIKALNHAFKQAKNEAQFLKQLHTHFDALRVLQFLHLLRGTGFKDVSWQYLKEHPTPFYTTNEIINPACTSKIN